MTGPEPEPERSARPTRRHLLLTGLGVAAGSIGAGVWRMLGAPTPAPARVRPPGAGSEARFLAACIRCGLCVDACPWDTLHLTDLADGLGAGTPTFDARRIPCWLCQGYDDTLCVVACPTEALRPLSDLREARMGLAVLDQETCWAFNGTICRSCWHACPYPNEAIRFDQRLRPVVVADACVGCGLCEHACPIEGEAAIVIRPLGEEA